MITYIIGEFTEIEDTTIIVEAYGVGYEIMVPGSVVSLLPPVGSRIKIYTYQNVKEDALDLYGFLTKDDLNIFKLLITVNGIGPKGALSILSSLLLLFGLLLLIFFQILFIHVLYVLDRNIQRLQLAEELREFITKEHFLPKFKNTFASF